MNNFLSNLFSETNDLYNHYIQLNHGSNHKVESTDANGNKVKHLRGYRLLDFYYFLKELEQYILFLIQNGGYIRDISIEKKNLDLFEKWAVLTNSSTEFWNYELFVNDESFYNKAERLMDNLVSFMNYVQFNLKKEYVNEKG